MARIQEIKADALLAVFAQVIGDARQKAVEEEMHSHRYFRGSSVAARHMTQRDAANKTADALEFARDRLAVLERERA